jgi:hypothetical protein
MGLLSVITHTHIGYFFQSVLVAKPGYDDTPAEAAARLAADREPGY